MKGMFSAFAFVTRSPSPATARLGGRGVRHRGAERADPPGGLRPRQRRTRQLPQGPERGRRISALVASGQTVYAGGDFTQVGGMPRRNVAAFSHVPGDLGTVLPFDGDVDGPVRALALSGDKLYAGGSSPASTAALPRSSATAATWPRSTPTTGLDRGWDPDADNVVRALAVQGDTVFAGGDFANVNSASRASGWPRSTQSGDGGFATGTRGPMRRSARWRPMARRSSRAATLRRRAVSRVRASRTSTGRPARRTRSARRWTPRSAAARCRP